MNDQVLPGDGSGPPDSAFRALHDMVTGLCWGIAGAALLVLLGSLLGLFWVHDRGTYSGETLTVRCGLTAAVALVVLIAAIVLGVTAP